jgi:uncharacterized repeat protein (TIGR01451 family)
LSTLVVGVALAGAFAVPAYAWHPQVKITKYVTNQTASGQMADANDAAHAVGVKPGDVIKYTIVVENPAQPAAESHNDLYFTKLTDSLPAGVELVSDPSDREIAEDLGVLTPGQKITKEYLLKVTSQTNNDVVVNKACVAGDSKVKDAPRKDCDEAVIKVTVTPPETPKTPETPQVMPETGAAGVFTVAAGSAVLGYIGNLIRIKRR